MERFVTVTPYATHEQPDGHQVQLVVGNQSFLLSDWSAEYHETKEAAEWVRDMLCIALDALVKECQSDKAGS
jgi:hypothetical protein